MNNLGLWGATILCTLVIWVSADQLLTESVELPIPITPRSERGSDFVVTPLDESVRRYLVTFSGRQGDTNKLRDMASAPVELTLSDEFLADKGVGSHKLRLVEELRSRPATIPGVTVTRVDPPELSVIVDRRLVQEVPVTIQTGRLDYAVEPRVQPSVVRVTLLQTQWDRVRNANPRVIVDAEGDLAKQAEGVPVKLDVPMAAMLRSDIGDVPVMSVRPSVVEIRATLRRRRKSGTIQAVPIKFLGGRMLWNQFSVEFRQPNPPETLRIDVVGTPEEVDKLVSGELKTFAVLSLAGSGSFEENTYQFYKPEFNLPQGVQVAEDQIIESFEIRLVRRPTSLNEAELGD